MAAGKPDGADRREKTNVAGSRRTTGPSRRTWKGTGSIRLIKGDRRPEAIPLKHAQEMGVGRANVLAIR
jgi:hypothetical protein